MSLITDTVGKRILSLCENISKGQLRVIEPNNTVHDFGVGEPAAEIKIHDWAAITALITRGDIGLGEAYTQGLWDSPSIEDFITVCLLNIDVFDPVADGSRLNKLKFTILNQILRRNNRKGSVKNIKSHYDVGNDFYSLWLDPSMTYSSALYDQGADNLSDAQHRKYSRMLDVIGDEANHVLEIGCGWGGFAEEALAQGRQVTGVTISKAQKAFVDNRLNGKADIRLQDYRDIKGKFDAIVSIEMIEAVGERYWPTYFSTLKNRLSESDSKSGRAIVQAITVPDELFADYRKRSDYLRHYTFPGGMLLSVAEIKKVATKAGLKTENILHFGQDYKTTLREWRKNMDAAEDKIRALGYSTEFLRSWHFYLDICAAAFRVERTNVIQVEFTHA